MKEDIGSAAWLPLLSLKALVEFPWAISIILYKVRKVMLAARPPEPPIHNLLVQFWKWNKYL